MVHALATATRSSADADTDTDTDTVDDNAFDNATGVLRVANTYNGAEARVSCYGGGTSATGVLNSSKSFLWTELQGSIPAISPYRPLVSAERYELVKYVSIDTLEEVMGETEGAFALEVPLSVIAPRCNIEELKSICVLHRVALPMRVTKTALLQSVLLHQCHNACEEYLPVFVPCTVCVELQSLTYRQDDIDCLMSKVKALSLDDLQSFMVIPDGLLDFYRLGARLTALRLQTGAGIDADPVSAVSMTVRAPWLKIANRAPLSVIHFWAKVHGVALSSRVTRVQALNILRGHECHSGCKVYISTFTPVQTPSRAPRLSSICQSDALPIDLTPPAEPLHRYPPQAVTDLDAAATVNSFCEDTHPSRFEESGCAVCGQLTLLADLVDLDEAGCSLSPLIEPGLVRIERKRSNERIAHVSEPVLDSTHRRACCSSCLKSLRAGRRPRTALANGLWLGQVPMVLSRLTYAEQCLVARVRSNRCVVRVSCGQSKMMANAISFPLPTAKVYQLLPPRREELDDVLAFIFSGVNAPTEEDLGRTPMLVRRNAVADALDWLKLNHCDYSDLRIDRVALDSYPISGIPVNVIYKSIGDTNIVPSTTSMHDGDEEEGTEEGECPLKVNGLVGSHLENMSILARKAAAVQHLRTGGHVLAVGRSDTPESLFDNPKLYPQMYPWLFPFGLGGPGNARVRGTVSEANHKKWLLMYHDKRFQTDSRFIIIAFNHEQIKRGSTGSFILTKRANFSSIVSRVSKLNPAVVMSIANRLKQGERVVPSSEEERTCFVLMDQVDHIGGSIQGSLASKKNMRSELWSLITHKGAPSWFITLSPADNRHPICIYWADKNVIFNPALRQATERVRLVARNPVAGARFFHYMVQLLIKHLLRWKSDDGLGIFGNTAAYYGTVEQQGRMTLHLHMLVWVSCALSPQEVKDKLLADDSEFLEELIRYLDSCQLGEFLTGTMRDMDKFNESGASKEPDPTQLLPAVAPVGVNTSCSGSDCACDRCADFRSWTAHYFETVDHVLYRSNVHKCYVRRDVLVEGVKKMHVTGKGCLNKDGVCTARFPRDIFKDTVVDSEGRLNLRKREPMINSVNKVMSYCFRCNTDCTCLMSGTAVKATVGYVADYIVKMGLKTYQIFSSIYDVFERHPDMWQDSKSDSDAARRLILKMANSLTSKIEIGGPMAAMYLLGNPDHYSSHSFVPFYWRPYVLYVENSWVEASSYSEQFAEAVCPQMYAYFEGDTEGTDSVDVDLSDGTVGGTDEPEVEGDSVVVTRSRGKIFSRSSVDDYRLRPVELSSVCLFDWIQCSQRVLVRKGVACRARHLQYAEGHPLRDTHRILYDTTRMLRVVPNAIGPYLPRVDGEDREYYCCVMMTIFVPWVSGLDLKPSNKAWSEAFEQTTFSTRHLALMSNMNIRYECYDARDDFHAQLRVRLSAQHDDADGVADDDEDEFDLLELDPVDAAAFDDEGVSGIWSRRMLDQMKEVQVVLQSAGWLEDGGRLPLQHAAAFLLERLMAPKLWKDLVAGERRKALNSRALAIPSSREIDDDLDVDVRPMNDARIIPGSYLLSEFRLNDVDVVVGMEQVVSSFSLNKEQERAFRIAANHSLCLSPEPLRMYIGGMGGTGKTQVIQALLEWFSCKGEGYRMVVLAPTGAAASIVNGSTYHSFLGVKTGDRRSRGEPSGVALDEARARMRGVDYIFLDEISMVSCQDLYLIDARLKEITQLDDLPFGGVNMVVAGDFAQLPPPKGQTLYSGQVAKIQQPRQVQSDQENTLGMLLWHQFVAVVILTQNMRQTALTTADKALRTALEHMRYKDCTADDIAFLRTLIPGHNPSLNLGDDIWRNVSVITALNVHKDQINTMNAHRFALENNTPLNMFYSVDKQTQQRVSKKTPKKVQSPEAQRIRLTESVQRSLWKSQPHTSEHIAGCLPVCVGMPVMIRHNEATELCVTKGQAAVVKGWNTHEHPVYPGHFVLDVLFVELVNPPKKIKIPYLPENAVPLTRITTAIKAILPNDLAISVSRQQVPVLLNFAMTDYASQGKTREVNVVDLKHCRNHQAIYTCLSRGKYADKTVILRDFDTRKITGGLSGFLREEFRTLDLLDEITEALYSGRLPSSVIQRLRGSTIMAYREWCRTGENACSIRQVAKVKSPEVHDRKRKISSDAGECPRKKRKAETPSGHPFDYVAWTSSWEWDSLNWSCAYDSVLTILRSVWTNRTGLYEGYVSKRSTYAQLLGVMFRAVYGGRLTLNECRKVLREKLWATNSVNFPRGRRGTDIFSLSQTLLGVKPPFDADLRVCASCSGENRGHVFERMAIYTIMRTELSERTTVSQYLTDLHASVGECGSCGGHLYLNNEHVPLFCVQLPNVNRQLLSDRLVIDREMIINGSAYALAGLVYWSPDDCHFAARVVRSPAEVYSYDGMAAHGKLTLEQNMASDDSSTALTSLGRRVASLAFFVAKGN